MLPVAVCDHPALEIKTDARNSKALRTDFAVRSPAICGLLKTP
jgi:hypothetical protein